MKGCLKKSTGLMWLWLIAAPGYGAIEETMVVSATKSSTDIKASPRTLTVIPAERIAERPGIAGLQSLLAEIPGIQYVRSGGLGGQIMMRGFNSNDGRMVLAIDGDRYDGRTTLMFNMIDPDSIERIEVIRGPASALYGSDAMTGVINIVTRRAKGDVNQPFSLSPHLRSAQWNSVNDLYGGRAEITGIGDGVDMLMGVSYRHAGDYDTPIGTARNSGFQSKAVDLNLGYRPTATSRWELSGRFVDVDTERAGGLGAAPGYPSRLVNEAPIIERYLRLGYQQDAAAWLADSWEATLYRRDFRTDIYQNNLTKTGYSRQHIQVYSPVIWGGHLTAQKQIDAHALSYGGDFSYVDNTSRTSRTQAWNKTGKPLRDTGRVPMERDTQMINSGLFINDSLALTPTVTLNGALRGDAIFSRIGDALTQEKQIQRNAFEGKTSQRHYAVTGSLGGVWAVTPAWHAVANLSRGFHAPSSQSMVMTSVAGTNPTLPNPQLKPETNITAETGVRWYGQGNQASLTLWQSRYDDLITLVPIGNNLWQRQNVARATLRGLELEGQSYLAENWSTRYSLAALWGANDTAGKPLPGIAPLTGTLALRYDLGDIYSEGVMKAYQGRQRIDTRTERPTAGFADFSLYVGGHLDALAGERFNGWKVVAGVENLFNRTERLPTAMENIQQPRGLGNPLVEPGLHPQTDGGLLMKIVGLLIALGLPLLVAAKPLMDHSQNQVQIPDQVNRVVTFPIPLASMMMALDGGPGRLVGMNRASRSDITEGLLGEIYPAAAKVPADIAGEGFAPNVEAVAATNPDLVFQWGDRGQSIIAPLRQLGLPVLTILYGDSRNATAWLELVGKAIGRETEAKALISWFDGEFNAVEAATAGLEPHQRPTVAYFYRAQSGWQLAGRGTSMDSDIQRSGGRNVAGTLPGFTPVGLEQLLVWDPDIILLNNFEAGLSPGTFYQDARLASLKAVKQKRIYSYPRGGFRWEPPSQESPLTQWWLVQLFHPHLAKPDFRQFTRAAYQRIYQYSLTEAQLDKVLKLDINSQSRDYCHWFCPKARP